jgi:Cu(I)/Ag(I) efflux system membrane protein CusA/SilA
MIEKIIEWSVKNRFIVIAFIIFAIAGGIYSMKNTPLDAIPDLSDVQVIVFTDYEGQSPEVVEDQVTYPLATAMLNVPYAKNVRGYSFFGTSFVYIIFEDNTDIYWARSRVLEYLNVVSDRLPKNAVPRLGPDATGVGWVYEYILEDKTGRHDLQELRSIQDWYLKYELSAVPGVSEVASIGGYVKQFQVILDPNSLTAFNIPIVAVRDAIRKSNMDVGGKLVEMGETEYMIRGLGYIKSAEDLENIVLSTGESGIPVLLKSIAKIKVGPELRRGIAELDGEGEVAGGIVVMRYGENALEVIAKVREKLEELKTGLPEGVEIVTVYDRSGLIERGIATLKKTLIEESIIVGIVCILFLLHFRSSFVVILTLPVAVLASFIIMQKQGINANIMSLGGIAIAIGVMVDAAIVMIENAHKNIELDNGKTPHSELILKSAQEVGPSLFFSLLIIAISFLPVFTLEAQEGRLFRPLAYTKTYAMLASSILAVTIVPVLMVYLVRGKITPEEKNPVNRFLIWIYRPLINLVLKAKWIVVAAAVIIMAVTVYPLKKTGSEFMPPLNEGDLLYMPTTLPGISTTKAKELLQQTDRIIKSFPEVERVFGKIGRAESATDPAPLSMIETTIMLKPEDQWRKGMTMEKLVEELDKAIQFPGLTNAWTMPIKTRLDMLSTGIKTPVGIKVMGEDLTVLAEIAENIEAVVRDIPGTASVFAERVTGGNFLDIDIKREEISRYGLKVADVQDAIKYAVGGMNVTTLVNGLERNPVNIRYGSELRDTPDKLKRVIVRAPSGAQIPLAQLADIKIVKGPPVVKSENARNTALIFVDLAKTDVGTYVKTAKKIVKEKVKLPPGYSLTWSGQYEYMVRAAARLKVVIPMTILIIFILLYMNFGTFGESMIVMLCVPFSLTGGFWLLYLLDYNFSVAVGVGFIALAGIATETGVIMLIYLDMSYKKFRSLYGENFNRNHLNQAIIEGAVLRVRPKMMTVVATMAGLMPIMWNSGTGAQVMKRIAAPMVGGMVSATILTLLVVPAIYGIWKGRGLK